VFTPVPSWRQIRALTVERWLQPTTGGGQAVMHPNYYERPVSRGERVDPLRFPRNHVRFHTFLKPLELVNLAHLRWNQGPLVIRDALLRELDAAAPLDEDLGTAQELARLRASVAAFGEGLDRNPFLSGIGRALLKQISLNFVRSRRKVLEHYAANKTYVQKNGCLRAPLLITGLPRTGSTLLQRLLSEDPATRSPYMYEMESPVPPLACGTEPLHDPRIAASGAAHGVVSRLAPGLVEKFGESHRWDPTEFEESFIYMLAHNGLSMMSAVAAGTEFIRDFTALEGKRPVLRYERIFFTMLDAYRPASSHWTLKAPNYAIVFPLVFDEYPDARVIVTHRNPLITYPSICRLLESWNIAFDQDGVFDKHRFARFVGHLVCPCMEVPFQYRKANPEKERQIFDCLYDELFADPIAMVKRIYAYFDLEMTPVFERRMKTYLQNNRQGKYGRHKYSLAEYGVDVEAFGEEHRDYMATYGFDPEGVRKPRPMNLSVPAS
jgi:hypothetical protein